MGLEKWLHAEENKAERIEKLTALFLAEGNTKETATAKAKQIVYAPIELEKIEFKANKYEGFRPYLVFFFANEQERQAIAQHFKVNRSNMVTESKKLIEKFDEVKE